MRERGRSHLHHSPVLLAIRQRRVPVFAAAAAGPVAAHICIPSCHAGRATLTNQTTMNDKFSADSHQCQREGLYLTLSTWEGRLGVDSQKAWLTSSSSRGCQPCWGCWHCPAGDFLFLMGSTSCFEQRHQHPAFPPALQLLLLLLSSDSSEGAPLLRRKSRLWGW